MCQYYYLIKAGLVFNRFEVSGILLVYPKKEKEYYYFSIMTARTQKSSSNRRRERPQSPKLPRASPFRSRLGFYVLLVTIFLVASSSIPLATAKEIEATYEWTLVGENDTVAAGMHVKMDLETGQKWVKLMDDDDENNKDSNGAENVSVQGTNLVASTKNKNPNDNAAEAQVDANGKVTMNAKSGSYFDNPNYNFELMHRTLSNLPPEEIEKMGGIPELPENYVTDDNAEGEERTLFEARMKEIWEQRQADLKDFDLADLPQLLKNRIQYMQEYLKDPQTHLQALDLTTASGDEGITDNNDFVVGDIVAVLQDLEYQLTDIDMARDFHTLGGWPLLTSLLADAVHDVGNQSDTKAMSNQREHLSEDDWNKVNLIQAHAAWTIGTTVKNTDEFNPYAMTEVEVLHHGTGSDGVVKTTTLDLVLAQFIASSTAVLDSTTSRQKDENYDTVVMKVHKTLYALGALLRANRAAQTHFCSDQGPALLENILSGLAEEAHASETPVLPQNTLKVAQRLLSLAQDIVMDATLHSSKSEQVDEAIRNAFSSPQWCNTVVRFTDMPWLYETALQTIQQLAPSCWDHWDLTKLKQQVEEPPEHVRQSWLPDDLDDEIRKDRMELLEITVKSIQDASSNATEEQ